MDNLRIILLICGVVLLAGIYIWGITVARRRKDSDTPADADAETENELELLERVQDARAAQNVESMTELKNVDIDENPDAGSATRAGTPRAPAGRARDEAAERRQLGADEEDHDDDSFRPVFADEVVERVGSAEDVSDVDAVVASLSEIRAALAPEPVINVDQLDLPGEEKESLRKKPRKQHDEPKAAPAGTKAAAGDDLVLAITVMAKEGERFEGAELRTWLEASKLRHGDMGIFHYRPAGKAMRAPPNFSVASVVKPGTFDIDEMADITVPGIAMFVQLPGPDDPSAAFEEMLRTARKLADGLGGVVCDETRSTLTGQAINHMRERIAEFSRRQRLRF